MSPRQKVIDFIREARWLDGHRARAYVRILAAIEILGLIGLIVTSRHGADLRGEPLGADFSSFWTAARLAWSGAPASVYDPSIHHAAEQAYFGARFGWCAFFYPPVFLLLCLPLALAPYFVSLAIWLAATGFFYLGTVRHIVAKKVGVLPILAFPAVFTTIGHGQNAFLSTALFGAGAAFLGKRPALAGVFFGALCYKPQLAVVLPLGLAVTGRWRTLFVTGATALALAALSFGVFGEATWRAFLAEAPLARATLEQGLVGPEKMQSLFAAIRLLGGSISLAYAGQAIMTAAVCAALVATLRRTPDAVAQGVLMAAAAPLATPFVLDYDLTLLALPLAYLLTRALATRFLPYEKIILLAAFALPAFARSLGEHAHLPLGAVVVALLFATLARRVRAEQSGAFAHVASAAPLASGAA